jgi:hypothetical protein
MSIESVVARAADTPGGSDRFIVCISSNVFQSKVLEVSRFHRFDTFDIPTSAPFSSRKLFATTEYTGYHQCRSQRNENK